MKRKQSFVTILMLVAFIFGIVFNEISIYAEADEQTPDESINIVEINDEIFTDDTFREYVRQFDGDGNGSLSNTEIANAKAIYIDDRQITNLNGIEYFTALEELECRNNEINKLDVSKNIKLKHLICDNNKLNDIDVSNNISLVDFSCGNNNLEKLDVSKNLDLEILLCDGANLKSLDVTNNTKLKALAAGDNKLTNLDLSKNCDLVFLAVSDNSIGSIDLTNNLKLEELYCTNCSLSNLDLSKNIKMTEIYCEKNNLTELDISKLKELKVIVCSKNNLSILDVTNNLKLRNLSCSYNHLTNLDVTKNIELTTLECNNNLISSLDLSNNLKLFAAIVYECPLLWINTGNNGEYSIDIKTEKSIDVISNKFDLSKVIDGIDVSKVTIISNGELKGNVVKVSDITKPVVYLYQDSNSKITVTLNLNKIISSDNRDKNKKAVNTGDQKSIELWSMMVGAMGILMISVKKNFIVK